MRNGIYRKWLVCTLLLIPTGVLAQTPVHPSGNGDSQRITDHMQTDVRAARETLDAIAQLGKSIQARQAAAPQQTAGNGTHASAKRGPFTDVPRTDGIYANLASLQEREILLGYPRGYFSAKRLLTRYECAVAIQRMLARCLPSENSQDMHEVPTSLNEADRRLLKKLVRDFSEELKSLGIDTLQYLDRLNKQAR